MLHIKICFGLAALVSLTGIGALAQSPAGSRPATPVPGPGTALGPPCADVLCDIQKDWARNNGMFYLTAQAMPEDKFGFKPTLAQQTFRERVLHVASVNVDLLRTLGGKVPPPAIDMNAASKAGALKELQKSSEYGAALLKEFTEAQLAERVPSAPFMGPTSSRQQMFYFLMTHTQDTYGQLVVYLRLSGITPPFSAQP